MAENVLEELERCETWLDVYDNPTLRDRLLHIYGNLKKILEDIKERRDDA